MELTDRNGTGLHEKIFLSPEVIIIIKINFCQAHKLVD